ILGDHDLKHLPKRLHAPNLDDLWNRCEQDPNIDRDRGGVISSVHSVPHLKISSKRSDPA
ncbi:MAG: hypothetical protein DRJ45_09125, partial [Thermoprotei archaeon]